MAVISPLLGICAVARITVVELFRCRMFGISNPSIRIRRVTRLKVGGRPLFAGQCWVAIPAAVTIVGCLAVIRAHLAQTLQSLTTRIFRWEVRICIVTSFTSVTFTTRTPLRPDDPMASMIAHIVVVRAVRAFLVAIFAHRVKGGLAVGVSSGRIGLTYRPSKLVRSTTSRVRVTVVCIPAGHAWL